MKQCRTCGVEKPLTDFYQAKRGRRAPYLDCKICHNVRTTRWHQKNPNKRRESNWAGKYGIQGFTESDYQVLLQLQVGCCKICGRAEPSGRRLAVDHDHSTGVVRGLLCIKCNTTIGWVEMHPALIDYLKG